MGKAGKGLCFFICLFVCSSSNLYTIKHRPIYLVIHVFANLLVYRFICVSLRTHTSPLLTQIYLYACPFPSSVTHHLNHPRICFYQSNQISVFLLNHAPPPYIILCLLSYLCTCPPPLFSFIQEKHNKLAGGAGAAAAGERQPPSPV